MQDPEKIQENSFKINKYEIEQNLGKILLSQLNKIFYQELGQNLK
jgi:hypothetical protein